jgi:hypothetical protein
LSTNTHQFTGSVSVTGSLNIASGLTTFTSTLSGSQPLNNPSSSLILISGSIRPTGSLTGASAVLMNTVMSASANNQTLVGLDIAPQFNNGAFTGVTNYAARFNGIVNIEGTFPAVINSNNTKRLCFGMLDSTFNAVGAYMQYYGNNFSNVASRGGFEIGFDTRNSGTGGVEMWGYNGSSYTRYFKLFTTGNLLLQNGGTFTDAGYRLDVNGNVIISGSLTIFANNDIEFQLSNTGLKLGNSILDSHGITGSLNISGSQTLTGSLNVTSTVTATSFVGNGSGLTGISRGGGLSRGQIRAISTGLSNLF